MNGYTELLRYFKKLGTDDIFVNTITQGDFALVDIAKKNIFPLMHVQVGNASFPSGSVVRFEVQLGIFDIRDINKEIITDKFWKQDNEVDNLNETLYSINRIWQLMSNDFEENDITASENPTLEQAVFERENLLDGWIMTFQVDVPNIQMNLCQ